MQYQYIIIGQGICGTWLSYQLHKAGAAVLVIDEAKAFTASRVASGIINPVTGRRMARTWLAEEVLPFAWRAYTEFGKYLNETLISQRNIISYHTTRQMQDAFDERMAEGETYLQAADGEVWKPYFSFYYGAGVTVPTYLIDIQAMLAAWRQKLSSMNLLLEEHFEMNRLEVSERSVRYKDITAEKIIFCDGVAGFDNSYFSLLPYANNKGEAIIAEIEGLPQTNIYKHGISIVPWQEDSLFWIGASFEWNYTDTEPSETYRRQVENVLQGWLKLPYKIVGHMASERPANLERRPFAGIHPHYPSVGILNGMGTKGCSLAPLFARQLAENLIHGRLILPQADVARFTKVLARRV